jgi:hypothetical protein
MERCVDSFRQTINRSKNPTIQMAVGFRPLLASHTSAENGGNEDRPSMLTEEPFRAGDDVDDIPVRATWQCMPVV